MWVQQACDCALKSDKEQALQISHRVLDVAWEQLHGGSGYKDVAACWRQTYALGSILVALSVCDEDAQHALSVVDKALIMAGAANEPLLLDVATMMDVMVKQARGTCGDGSKRSKKTIDKDAQEGRDGDETSKNNYEPLTLSMPLSETCQRIHRVAAPSLEVFLTNYLQPQQPVIITGGLNHWPAVSEPSRRWSLNYLNSKFGDRTVPIEVGKSYLHEDWGQFDQLPELREDICVPDYCSLSPPSATQTCHGGNNPDGAAAGNGEGDGLPASSKRQKREGSKDVKPQTEAESLAINAWFGPKGTVSPSHTDPYDNLLCQVVGQKYLRLYPPSASPKMYPHENNMHKNSSQVDVAAPDLSLFPEFATIEGGLECSLGEGEMLFIPKGWWHYVQSLSISFSVSFWWE